MPTKLSHRLADLRNDFIPSVETMISNTEKRNVKLCVVYTTRTPRSQTILWSQSRTEQEVERVVKILKTKAPFLAETIKKWSIPMTGRWATNLLPGQSWHQWGEAVDCCVLNSFNQAVWSSQHQGYHVYAAEAKSLGLNPGHFWRQRDSIHVQMREASVRDLFQWEEIDREMAKRFAIESPDQGI